MLNIQIEAGKEAYIKDKIDSKQIRRLQAPFILILSY